MNIYIVTEGKAEAIVYKYWIPLVNPKLYPVDNLTELNENSFYIISAKGYPYYFNAIDGAIADINLLRRFARLVIAVDSEDMSRDEKYREIKDYVADKECMAEIKIVIQHFCFETWGLGNRKVVRKNPTTQKLLEYKRLFDIRTKDPELLPAKPDEGLNRSQFAEKYLRLALNDRFRDLTYTKGNPQALIHDKYFEQIRNRFTDTGHISSFSDFLTAFT